MNRILWSEHPNAEARVQHQAAEIGICGTQSVIRTSFSPSLSAQTSQDHSTGTM